MLKKIVLSLLVSLMSIMVSSGQAATKPPQLVVNIVVGAMRAGDIERYRYNFWESGFLRLADGGVNFTNANYSFHQTITPVSLATLTTGALPSTHGVIGQAWWEYILGDKVDIVQDSKVKNLEYDIRDYGYSASQLVIPTLSETLICESPNSKSISIALEPSSAIIMSGRMGIPYWFDPMTSQWSSSTAFMPVLPDWVKSYNSSAEITSIANKRWVSLFEKGYYINDVYSTLKPKTKMYESATPPMNRDRVLQHQNRYNQLAYTPAGNSAIFNFALRAFEDFELGVDGDPDILNIYLDPSRNIAQRYGVKSVEVEDMYYHLNLEIETFIEHITSKLGAENILVVLTSDHGMSSGSDENLEPQGRFNAQQFVTLVNSFLRARYGGDDDWVLGYSDKNLYLNRKTIFKHELSVSEVQNEVATFALQFRGVAHAMTATAMRNGYFASGYGHKMQNSFYPRRSGDVVINFMPGWVEDRENIRADAGSTYRYDSHVPLVIYGEGYLEAQSITREVVMEDLAPTLSHLLQIEIPAAADGKPIEEIF